MPEKLISIKEVAEYLHISEDEVKRLVDIGEIPAYKIGGTFLRFRKEQIDVIRAEISEFEKTKAAGLPMAAPIAAPRTEIAAQPYDYTFIERIKDFFYFNDFYIISFIIIAVLLYLIFKV